MHKQSVVLFLFGGKASSRSFHEFKILDRLNEKAHFDIVCGLRTHTKSKAKNPFYQSDKVPVIEIEGESRTWIRHQLWVQIAMARRARNNSGYFEKTRIILLGNLRRSAFSNLFRYVLYVLSNICKPRNLPIYFAKLPIIGRFVETLFWYLIPRNTYLETVISSLDPTLVVVVSNGQEPLLAEVQRIRNKIGQWVFIPDNWDNLFTKSVIRYKPREIWVWGEQQHLQVQKLGLYAENENNFVVRIGNSRVGRKSMTKSPSTKPTLKPNKHFRLLFAGKESPHDEIADLQWLISQIHQTGFCMKRNIDIEYRPHPTAKPRASKSKSISELTQTEAVSCNSVILTTRLSSDGFKDRHNEKLAKSLSTFDLVITEPTTLILESLVTGVPTVVLLRDDFLHRTNSSNQWDYFDYFRGLENVSGLYTIRTEKDARFFFNSLMQNKIVLPTSSLEYFLGSLTEEYSLNLAKAIERLSESTQSKL